MHYPRYKSPHLEMWLEEGIIYLIYEKHAEINEAIAREIIKERLLIAENHSYPCYLDLTNGPQFDKAARDIFSTGDAMKQVSAGAMIISNRVQQLIGNAFLQIQKPSVPAKIFVNKQDAIRWLSYYKRLN